MKKNINKDYIGVVKEHNGAYKFEQVPIVESFEIKEQLRAMCENPNRTLLDMQEAFAMNIKTDKKAYACCMPYSYSSSYIDWVRYPKIKTYNEYQTDKQAQINEIEDAVRKDVYVPQSEKEQKIKERTEKYEQSLKDEFLRAALRYIETMDFTATKARVKAMDAVKMSSHEYIGWTAMEYRINKDLRIKVMTNFGYGSSSYFFVNVCYKGIDLLPYAQTVNYYYARMQDIIAHTRSYRAERDSWHIALDFVANLSDRTRIGLEKLVCEWLHNEITEMIAGLKNIKEDPKMVLAKAVKNKLGVEGNLVSVRSISDLEVKEYGAYPDELALVFKMEKISNALRLLKKLEQTTAIYPDATQAIQTIKELNQAIVPEISRAIEEIKCQLSSLKDRLKPIAKELSNLYAQKKEQDEMAYAVYERWNRRIPDLTWNKFIIAYNEKHKKFVTLQNTIIRLSNRKKKIETEIFDRKSFVERLQKCYADIARAKLLAA